MVAGLEADGDGGLDLASTSVAHQAELVAHLLEFGATRADAGQCDVPWTVLADPEGNLFRVLEPRSIYRDTGPIAAVLVNCADARAMARFCSHGSGAPAVPGGPAGSVGLSPDVLSVVAGFGVTRTGVEGLARGWLLAARETVRLAGPDNGLGAAGSGLCR